VELAEQERLRLPGCLVDTDPEDVEVGAPVEVVFVEVPDIDRVVPFFRLVRS
jgi:uncharacterized OB-fold protein